MVPADGTDVFVSSEANAGARDSGSVCRADFCGQRSCGEKRNGVEAIESLRRDHIEEIETSVQDLFLEYP